MKSFLVLGGIMKEDKIKILFKQLKLTEEEEKKLSFLSLSKVKVNEKVGSWIFVLKSEKVLEVNDYKLLEEKLEIAFKDIKHVSICIEPVTKDNSLLKEYFCYALTKVKDILAFAPIFQDSLIEMDDSYYIETTNKA